MKQNIYVSMYKIFDVFKYIIALFIACSFFVFVQANKIDSVIYNSQHISSADQMKISPMPQDFVSGYGTYIFEEKEEKEEQKRFLIKNIVDFSAIYYLLSLFFIIFFWFSYQNKILVFENLCCYFPTRSPPFV